MHIIYATGTPRLLEFACARARHEVPAAAIVFAICDGLRKQENLDEDTFAAMTDEEYYTLRGLVQDAVRLEAQTPAPAPAAAGPMRRLLCWLSGQPVAGRPERLLRHVNAR